MYITWDAQNSQDSICMIYKCQAFNCKLINAVLIVYGPVLYLYVVVLDHLLLTFIDL